MYTLEKKNVADAGFCFFGNTIQSVLTPAQQLMMDLGEERETPIQKQGSRSSNNYINTNSGFAGPLTAVKQQPQKSAGMNVLYDQGGDSDSESGIQQKSNKRQTMSAKTNETTKKRNTQNTAAAAAAATAAAGPLKLKIPIPSSAKAATLAASASIQKPASHDIEHVDMPEEGNAQEISDISDSESHLRTRHPRVYDKTPAPSFAYPGQSEMPDLTEFPPLPPLSSAGGARSIMQNKSRRGPLTASPQQSSSSSLPVATKDAGVATSAYKAIREAGFEVEAGALRQPPLSVHKVIIEYDNKGQPIYAEQLEDARENLSNSPVANGRKRPVDAMSMLAQLSTGFHDMPVEDQRNIINKQFARWIKIWSAERECCRCCEKYTDMRSMGRLECFYHPGVVDHRLSPGKWTCCGESFATRRVYPPPSRIQGCTPCDHSSIHYPQGSIAYTTVPYVMIKKGLGFMNPYKELVINHTKKGPQRELEETVDILRQVTKHCEAIDFYDNKASPLERSQMKPMRNIYGVPN